MKKFIAFLFLTVGAFAINAAAQTPENNMKPSVLPGVVAALDPANNQISLRTKSGDLTVLLDGKTIYKRVSPDKPTDLKAAIDSNLSEIGVGDSIVAVGILSTDKKTVPARSVYLMTKADIAKKQATDSEKWATRGIVGRVTGINPAANEITVALRGNVGAERFITIAANDKTSFRRYAQNSVKFSDAKNSSFGELKVGDQLRAMGERTTDGLRMTAEEVVFGSFRMVAGKITQIDVAKNEVTIKDIQTDKNVTISVGNDTLLRRFPAEMAQRMAQMQAMRAAGMTPPGTGQGNQAGAAMSRPNPQQGAGQTAPNAGGQGMRQGGGMMGRGGDVDQMLERMPALNLSELKVGDAIAASSTASAPDRVTAIKFVAGIEPFLNAPQMPNMPQGNRQQAAPSINIPGLDGIGAP